MADKPEFSGGGSEDSQWRLDKVHNLFGKSGSMARAIRSKGSADSLRKIGKCIEVETKPATSPSPKKQRVSSSTTSRKGKDVVVVKTPFDQMGCKTKMAVRDNVRSIRLDMHVDVGRPTDLTILAHFVHILVSRSLTPRKRSHSLIFHYDLFLMWCVLKGKKIDLAYVIYHHIKSAQSHQKVPIPYGMHLTMFFKQIDKSVIQRKVHEERSDRNNVLDMKNLVMMGLVFYEITCRWVEKVPGKAQGGEGDGDKQGGNDDEDDKLSQVDHVPILVNGMEVHVIESAEEREYEQNQNFDTHFDEGKANPGGDE
ncbi:hypothetical protein Sjap_004791 [Stephania japonica]|uniref:Uncharacterized protein n=1 Tax=Stephania japonica TaxID=461633 RepID=A0AAP0K4D4_9MAGN